jgi:uncharacterized protein YkwD
MPAARSRALTLAAVLATALGLLLPPAASAQRACQSAGAQPMQASRMALSRATVCLLNGERARRGIRPLKVNKRLNRAARRHAIDMATRDYFSHTSQSGASFVDRIRRSGYLRRARSWFVGENIAWGTGTLSTPRSIVRAWMESPGHRANILSRRFREVGIGISFGAPVHAAGNPSGTYTTSFGRRR